MFNMEHCISRSQELRESKKEHEKHIEFHQDQINQIDRTLINLRESAQKLEREEREKE